MNSMCYSDCTVELLKTFATLNDIPFCGGEAAHRFLFMSSLVDDLGPEAISKADLAKIWVELTGGINPPGKYQY